MKILGLVGSMRGEYSKEYTVVKRLMDSFSINDGDKSIITANNINVSYCKGCMGCFGTGICPLDKEDEITEVKNKLILSDLLIISSPVYLHSISGKMKSIIDRLSYWTHIFQLVGKRIVLVTSTSSNGSEYALSYLKKAFEAMGGIIVGEISIDMLTTDAELNLIISDIKRKVSASFSNPKLLKSSMLQHCNYKEFRKLYIKEDTGFEYEYWLKNKMFDYATFEDYLSSKLLLSN